MGTPASSTSKTDRRHMTEILLKVALSPILTNNSYVSATAKYLLVTSAAYTMFVCIDNLLCTYIGLIYPVLTHWAWSSQGWLAVGFTDDDIAVSYSVSHIHMIQKVGNHKTDISYEQQYV